MMIDEVYVNLCQAVTNAYKDLNTKQDKHQKDLAMLGSLSEQRQEELNQAQRFFPFLFLAFSCYYLT